MGNLTGESDFLHQKECLAGNPKVYAQLVHILGKYSKFASVEDKMAATEAVSSTLLGRHASADKPANT